MSILPPRVLNLQPLPPQSPYHSSPSFTFHPYEHDVANDDGIAPPSLSSKRASRLSAPFPTFLYASEPPPVTARNKQRIRPTAAQLAELKALYLITPHPAREVREDLGRRIGMRYQSVTNWFQNQRSTAKKRAPAAASTPAQPPPRSVSSSMATSIPSTTRDHEDDGYASAEDDSQSRYDDGGDGEYARREPSPTPTRQRMDPVRDIIFAQAAARHQHTSELPLPLSGAAIMLSSFPSDPDSQPLLPITLPPPPRTTPIASSAFSRAPTSPLLSSFQVSRPPSPRAVSPGAQSTPGPGTDTEQVPRGKRSRPTPHQLVALRALHAFTSSPTIEERTRVGREIGMELGKVTNWFRNLRQTARKKERRALQVEGVISSSKRSHSGDDGPIERERDRYYKRARHSGDEDEDDEDDDDTMSVSHSHTGACDTSSTAGSVDMEYEYDRDRDRGHGPQEALFTRGHGQQLEDERYHYHQNGYLDMHEGWRFQGYTGHRDHDSDNTPFHPGHQDHDHEHEVRSEQDTESDAAHEAVTPEPHHHHNHTAPALPADSIPTTPRTTTPASSRGSPSPMQRTTHTKHASVDDALLLLAFHGAQQPQA